MKNQNKTPVGWKVGLLVVVATVLTSLFGEYVVSRDTLPSLVVSICAILEVLLIAATAKSVYEYIYSIFNKKQKK